MRILLGTCAPFALSVTLIDWGIVLMTNEFRIAKVQKTLRYLEDDIPLLNMRVKELSQ